MERLAPALSSGGPTPGEPPLELVPSLRLFWRRLPRFKRLLVVPGSVAAVTAPLLRPTPAECPFCRPEEKPFLLLESTLHALEEILLRHRGLPLLPVHGLNSPMQMRTSCAWERM